MVELIGLGIGCIVCLYVLREKRKYLEAKQAESAQADYEQAIRIALAHLSEGIESEFTVWYFSLAESFE